MNMLASCTMFKLLILVQILELGYAPLEQHTKTVPIITPSQLIGNPRRPTCLLKGINLSKNM